MGAAVSAMVLGMVLAGVAVSPVELVLFPILALINAVLLVLLLRSIREDTVADRPAVSAAPRPGAYQPAPR
jgi:hypothetical protein